jgi:hypothetical protein
MMNCHPDFACRAVAEQRRVIPSSLDNRHSSLIADDFGDSRLGFPLERRKRASAYDFFLYD